MAKRKKPRDCDLAYAAEEFVKKHKLDPSEPSHLNSIAKAFSASPALILRLLRIQRELESSVTARWRLPQVYTVATLAMEWLVNQHFKTEAEQHAAYGALQYATELEA